VRGLQIMMMEFVMKFVFFFFTSSPC